MTVHLAIVHHANQYLIAEGYDNREGLSGVLGTPDGPTGLARILELHRRYAVPLNLHISGTLLEAIAWGQPACLEQVRELHRAGLIGFVGSCYAQNIMRLFGYAHNLAQLNEELLLYRTHLGVDPAELSVFWPPERVWHTDLLAPVLTDPRLLNGGYRAVLLDDRLWLAGQARQEYDDSPDFRPELFRAARIQNGLGLVALPISTHLRHAIPPRSPAQLDGVHAQLGWLRRHDPQSLAIYADDMEKVAGIGGWDADGPRQYEAFLAWLARQREVVPVKLGEWLGAHPDAERRRFEPGTFYELAREFGAGEDYAGWHDDPRWTPCRQAWEWAETRVASLSTLGADPSLIELAEKQLLAGAWETAWHTPNSGVHGDAHSDGDPSPWARALAIHARHAATTAEAAYWARHHNEQAHAYLYDIDGDGDLEIVVKNDKLFAVLAPECGGRLVALFHVDGSRAAMMIGNPSDDWNWQEALNRAMDVPRNHPGALTDVAFEHDRYAATILDASGSVARVRLENAADGSIARELTKTISLEYGASALRVCYELPNTLARVEIECGLSPDYLGLLRNGRGWLRSIENGPRRGASAGPLAVWIEPGAASDAAWVAPPQPVFGHGIAVCLASSARTFELHIGVDTMDAIEDPASMPLAGQHPVPIFVTAGHRAKQGV